MTARAIWKGRIVIAALEVPVKMYSAVQDRKVHFHLLHARDLTPVQQRIVRKTDGKEVPAEEQLKAYPVEAEAAVLVRPGELEMTEPPPSRDIDCCRFVSPALIGDAWYERPYYLGPDGDEPGYFALVEALQGKHVVGIARWTMRKKRYVGALGAIDGYLNLVALRRAEQVLSVSGLEIPQARKPDEREVKLAQQLVDAIAADFEPKTWHDEYRERVLNLIDAKARGAKIIVPRPKPAPKAAGLADQLRRSLELAKEKKVA